MPAPQPLHATPTGSVWVSAEFSRWLMGFPSGWHGDIGNTAALGLYGNAVVPQVAAAFVEHYCTEPSPLPVG